MQPTSLTSTAGEGPSTSNTNSNNHKIKTEPTDDNGPSQTKRAKLKERISYDDLAPRTRSAPVTLKLERTEGYYHGPTQISSMEYSETEVRRDAMQRVQDQTAGAENRKLMQVRNYHRYIQGVPINSWYREVVLLQDIKIMHALFLDTV